MPDTLKDRIKQRLDELDLSARRASLEAGLNADTLGKVLNGNTRNLRGDNLSAIARVLKTSESWLTGGLEHFHAEEDGAPEPGVRYGGIVEAGAFRQVDLLDQDGEQVAVPIASDPRFPASAQAAWRAEGDSMTEAGILPGMYVLAVDLRTYERIMGEPRDGKLVIVARHQGDSDPARELTVKRLRFFRDRIELQPESKNPKHQPIIFPRNVTADQATTAEIVAVVLQSINLHA